MLYVIPKRGLSLRDPHLADRLPPEGRMVPDTLFWRRRLRDGDVFLGQPPAEPAAQEQPAAEPAGQEPPAAEAPAAKPSGKSAAARG